MTTQPELLLLLSALCIFIGRLWGSASKESAIAEMTEAYSQMAAERESERIHALTEQAALHAKQIDRLVAMLAYKDPAVAAAVVDDTPCRQVWLSKEEEAARALKRKEGRS